MTSEDNGARTPAGARWVRHDGWTAERRRGFVEALAQYGNVRDACRAVGLSNTSAYALRRRDPAFGAAWDAALTRAATSLEAIAYQRAMHGAEEIVIRDGKEAWRKRKPSDSILRMILQASNPEKYGRTGGQSAVKAREEVEARIEEIERAAYVRAWQAFSAEYRYQLEPEYARHYLMRKLHVIHSRMCGHPRCRECHPERADSYHVPVRHDGKPLPPMDELMREFYDMEDAERKKRDPNAAPVDRTLPERPPELSRWFAEKSAALKAERIACNLEGREMEMGRSPLPLEETMPCPPDRR